MGVLATEDTEITEKYFSQRRRGRGERERFLDRINRIIFINHELTRIIKETKMQRCKGTKYKVVSDQL